MENNNINQENLLINKDLIINHQQLFRDDKGTIKPMLSTLEGISFQESPLDFFILLARYKFAARFIKKNHSVLDAGCGHGNGSVFLSKFAKEVKGADFDQDLINSNSEQYKSIPNLSFSRINLLDVNDFNTFDVVVSMDVIEHFTKEQTEIVASNYAKLTSDNGFAIIGTPNIASQPFASKRRIESHIHEFEPQEFETLLKRHFKNVFLFSMTDETVSTSFSKMAWYLMAICTK
ncbi:methyltransferase domain-containing protein [Silvanigrella paludirubra]|uniref:Methyltransferase domain-containing protein n=1 Tax=Silvanigrella paludirubra TaxID=2499159 RepID=A0A6N6VSJ1_9BACT|nr:methyltransferase domain-containing protein [Silvanigrella paludirubra]KAB8036825.1 methyltransferase domain-containing protein [Silvanigrella paludirubra]